MAVLGVGDPSPVVGAAAERILALAADAVPAWPGDLPAGDGLDTDSVLRSLRAGGVRFGSMRLGLPIDGDGLTSSTFEIEGDRGRLQIKVTLDPETGVMTEAALLVPARELSPEAW